MFTWGDLTSLLGFLKELLGLLTAIFVFKSTKDSQKQGKRPSAKKKRYPTQNSSKKRKGKRK